MLVWVGTIVVWLIVIVVSARPEKRTLENLLGLLVVQSLLCVWFSRIALRLRSGRGHQLAIGVMCGYLLLGLMTACIVMFGFKPDPNASFVGVAWLLQALVAVFTIHAVLRSRGSEQA